MKKPSGPEDDLRPKCDVPGCPERSTHNYQKLWVDFKVRKDGSYNKNPFIRGMDIEEPTGEDNRHYCDAHSQDFEEGNL